MKPADPSRDTPAGGHGYDDGVVRPQAGDHHSAEELHNEGVAHEHADINIRAVLASAVGLAVIVGVVYLMMYGVFRIFERQAMANDVDVSPLAAPATEMPGHVVGPAPFGTAPAPQLLTNEYAALEEHRAREAGQLSAYGWVDEQTGVARMPIAEAKKLLVERGLPVRPTVAADDPTAGTIRPAMGESSSGRTPDGPPRGSGIPEIGAPPATPQPRVRAPGGTREH